MVSAARGGGPRRTLDDAAHAPRRSSTSTIHHPPAQRDHNTGNPDRPRTGIAAPKSSRGECNAGRVRRRSRRDRLPNAAGGKPPGPPRRPSRCAAGFVARRLPVGSFACGCPRRPPHPGRPGPGPCLPRTSQEGLVAGAGAAGQSHPCSCGPGSQGKRGGGNPLQASPVCFRRPVPRPLASPNHVNVQNPLPGRPAARQRHRRHHPRNRPLVGLGLASRSTSRNHVPPSGRSRSRQVAVT